MYQSRGSEITRDAHAVVDDIPCRQAGLPVDVELMRIGSGCIDISRQVDFEVVHLAFADGNLDDANREGRDVELAATTCRPQL